MSKARFASKIINKQIRSGNSMMVHGRKPITVTRVWKELTATLMGNVESVQDGDGSHGSYDINIRRTLNYKWSLVRWLNCCTLMIKNFDE